MKHRLAKKILSGSILVQICSDKNYRDTRGWAFLSPQYSQWVCKEALRKLEPEQYKGMEWYVGRDD